MKPIISAYNLSKRYYLNHSGGYHTLKEALGGCFRKFATVLRCGRKPAPPRDEFWALRDLSFDVKPGDRLGLIGRNGAGKSTLLKILSRIVEPTRGGALIRGRVSSLLEVGTGFHPELTGRENIFLNGAILGMTRQEIRRKFDEIIAFSEIERFLDTPVKRFSSGMHMRLGFAIAAHLDPELLIVDEVLAVGDRLFKEKCLNKMDELGRSGRTIIFVSHDIGSMLTLCTTGLYLEGGEVKAHGPIAECVNSYLKQCRPQGLCWQGSIDTPFFSVNKVSLTPSEEAQDYFIQGQRTAVWIEGEVKQPSLDSAIQVGVWNNRHQLLAYALSSDAEQPVQLTTPGPYHLALPLDAALFHPGEYWIKISLIKKGEILTPNEAQVRFSVYPRPNQSAMQRPENDGMALGCAWSLNASSI